jgi:hypothetical protein
MLEYLPTNGAILKMHQIKYQIFVNNIVKFYKQLNNIFSVSLNYALIKKNNSLNPDLFSNTRCRFLSKWHLEPKIPNFIANL